MYQHSLFFFSGQHGTPPRLPNWYVFWELMFSQCFQWKKWPLPFLLICILWIWQHDGPLVGSSNGQSNKSFMLLIKFIRNLQKLIRVYIWLSARFIIRSSRDLCFLFPCYGQHWSGLSRYHLGLPMLPAHSTLLNLRQSQQNHDHRYLSSVFLSLSLPLSVAFWPNIRLWHLLSASPKVSFSSKVNSSSVFVLSLRFEGLNACRN